MILMIKHPTKRKEFVPADYVRKDWDDHHIEFELKRRARGYSGLLRQLLCSAAAVIVRQRLRIAELEQEVKDVQEAADDEARAQSELDAGEYL